jgi:hypothetical protein
VERRGGAPPTASRASRPATGTAARGWLGRRTAHLLCWCMQPGFRIAKPRAAPSWIEALATPAPAIARSHAGLSGGENVLAPSCKLLLRSSKTASTPAYDMRGSPKALIIGARTSSPGTGCCASGFDGLIEADVNRDSGAYDRPQTSIIIYHIPAGPIPGPHSARAALAVRH